MQNQQLSLGSKGHPSSCDMLYTVMDQCKSAEKVGILVQDVTCAFEPMTVLCTKQKLITYSVLHFCCYAFCFSIQGMDPTFNLGEYSGTPTVFRV